MVNSTEKLNGKSPESLPQDSGVSSKEAISNLQIDKIKTGEVVNQLVEQVPGVEAGVEESAGGFGEEDSAYKAKAPGGSAKTTSVSGRSQIYAQPPIQEMITQTVAAIEEELKKTEDEMKLMLKGSKTSPYLINDKAKKIRFLNSILTELQRAAQLAEDFIVGLWKRYVKKN